MNKISINCLWVAIIIGSAFGLYRVKYEVRAIRAQIATVNQELAQEKESLRVVSAEWAYLNRPERLQQLADKYLTSKQLTVAQMADIKALPFPIQMQAAITP
jgi:cell division protein FtsL